MRRKVVMGVLTMVVATAGWVLGASVVTAEPDCDIIGYQAVGINPGHGSDSPEAALLAQQPFGLFSDEFPDAASMQAAIDAPPGTPTRIELEKATDSATADVYDEGRLAFRARLSLDDLGTWNYMGWTQCRV